MKKSLGFGFNSGYRRLADMPRLEPAAWSLSPIFTPSDP